FDTRLAPQIGILGELDTELSAMVREPVGKEGVFAFGRTFVAFQRAEHMGGNVGTRVEPGRLNLQVRAHGTGALLRKEGYLDRGQVRSDRQRQSETGFIMPLEIRGV